MNEFEKLSKERKDLQKAGEVPEWMTTQGYIMFVRKYAYNKETVKGAFHRIASTLAEHYPEKTLAYEKFFNLLWKGYLSPSTPIYCNTGTDRGLVVSCAGSYIDDSISGFYNAYLENAILSKLGFGTSSYLGDIRARGSSISIGGTADGVVPVFDSSIDVVSKVSQGSNRRGAWAGYLDIDHDDFWELTGYILKNPVDTNIGWNITEAFIEKLKNQDEEAIKRWNKIVYLRARVGKGYLWKVDTANNLAPQAIKNSGISIKASNLCNEIALPQDSDHTFTCVLSSLNLSKWDEFEEDTIFWSIIFLDCVVSEMLLKAKKYPELKKAVNFTEKSRALGLGVLAFHTYLQEKMVAFDSFEAHMINLQIFKKIESEAKNATKHLAELLGEPLWCQGLGIRNATLTAVAPTMSSSILCGSVSQGIEPIISNTFNQKTAAGEMQRINPTFAKLAKQKGFYSQDLVDDIAINHNGSVQHLDWLSEEEKAVFKTAYEIDQHALLRLASTRQQFIDQGQSLNLFFGAEEDENYVAEVHKAALLDPYIKGLYYLRSTRGVKASKGCVACE